MAVPRAQHPPPRILVERVEPVVDCGRYPAKRTVGDRVVVRADLIRDGHEVLRAVLRARAGASGRRKGAESAMWPIDAHIGGTRWEGHFEVTEIGPWRFEIEAWADHFASWRQELDRKIGAGQEDLASELAEGAAHLEAAAASARGDDRRTLARAAGVVSDEAAPWRERAAAALAEETVAAADRAGGAASREDATVAGPFDLRVDRERARFGSWYELFPRSWGGLKGVARQIPKLADLGFDVVYLPPIHPIGVTNRKGANNALVAGKRDPGSPWAIGLHGVGGHDALHPDLGTWEDFDALIAAANAHGIDIALDFAIQCSADHPWLTEHPDWFHRRPDGTLKYAENPPKRYQDIYNVNWDSPDWRGLWKALHDALMVWVDRGVRIFRVDNPHTKPLAFWEWLIAEVQRTHPDVVFLAEAFTKAPMMRALAKVGFSQSYTYFTWKNSREELIDYVVELATSGMQEYFRPNFFANTPDILHAYLVDGGPAAFHARLVLAATLSPTYGIYSGFESFENVPVAPGSEEYLDSEKYEVKKRRLDGPLLGVVKRLNMARRAHPALQRLDDVWFLDAGHDQLLAYAKTTDSDRVIVVVNIDPHHAHEGSVVVPELLELPGAFAVVDLLGDTGHEWRTGPNFVRLEPGGAHVMAVR